MSKQKSCFLLQICVSCCDSMYCNEGVPTNHTNAVFSATITPQPPHQTSPNSAATAIASSAATASHRRTQCITRGVSWEFPLAILLASAAVTLWSVRVFAWLTNFSAAVEDWFGRWSPPTQIEEWWNVCFPRLFIFGLKSLFGALY